MADLKGFEWLIIVATVSGPILAVQAQKFLENIREKRQRKFGVFDTLMATRAARVSDAHVRALNMIDIAFYGRKFFAFRLQLPKEKRVTESWKVYRDHLSNPLPIDDPNWKEKSDAWMEKSGELLTELLYNMAQYLSYDFDKVDLKRSVYYPTAHSDREQAELLIREGLLGVLSGRQPLAMSIVSVPDRNEGNEQEYQSNTGRKKNN
ncbi:MAG TPA: DUF6680 family protein [Desulfomonilaceae bacterium]|nr:DUF6680 family protein [Desulfomonilaceae bacterium]